MNTQLSLQEQINALMAENAKLKSEVKAPKPRGIYFKVSPKGAVSIYGMGKWPVTLYKSQLRLFLKHVPELETFVNDSERQGLLSTKGDAVQA